MSSDLSDAHRAPTHLVLVLIVTETTIHQNPLLFLFHSHLFHPKCSDKERAQARREAAQSPKTQKGKVSGRVGPRKPLVVVGLTPTISIITPGAAVAEGARVDNSAETRMTSASTGVTTLVGHVTTTKVPSGNFQSVQPHIEGIYLREQMVSLLVGTLPRSTEKRLVIVLRTGTGQGNPEARTLAGCGCHILGIGSQSQFYIEPALLPPTPPQIGSSSSASSSSLLKVQQEELGLLEGHVMSLVTLSKREPHLALLVSRKVNANGTQPEYDIIFWNVKKSMESKRFHEMERWLVTGMQAREGETILSVFVIRSCGSDDNDYLGDDAVVVAKSSMGRVYVIKRKNPAAPHLVQSAGSASHTTEDMKYET
ncbi:hypothetical protein Pelo_15800 [Pelomyxa schiedti]|nr:hypothetical protein Pelo_15800 [Pelomyxa schiedti]